MAKERDPFEDALLGGPEEQAIRMAPQPDVEPDAASFERAFTGAVSGPTTAQMEVIVSGLPDNGRIVRMPNGEMAYVSSGYSTTDQDKIRDILRNLKGIQAGEVKEPGEAAVSQIRQEALGDFGLAGGVGLKTLEGAPFVGSYAEEAIAGDDPRKLRALREVSKAMESEYPKTSTAAGLTGLLAGTMATGAGGGEILSRIPAAQRAAAALEKMPVSARAATGAATTGALGATEGAIYGYGKGTDEASRQREALGGAQIGGLVGAPVGAVVPYLGRLWSAFVNRGSQTSVAPEIAAQFGISTEAARMIENALESGATFDAMVNNIRRAGDQGMIADADKAVGELLDAAGASSPAVSSMVRRPVEERAAASSRQLGEEMDVALGVKPQGQQTSYEAIASRSKEARSSAYNDAFNTPIDYASSAGYAIEEVLRRVPNEWKREAIARANRSMQAAGKQNQQIMADIAEDGTVTFREMPNVQQLHEIKVALNQYARSPQYTDLFGNVTGEGVTIAQLAGDLRNALGDAVPAYNKAAKIGGDKIREQEALILGGKVLSPQVKRDEVVSVLKNASADERAAAKLGLRNSIDEAMANARTAATTGRDESVSEAMKILSDLSTRANKTKVELILGKKVSDDLFKRLDETRSALELQALTARGSQTALRTATRETAAEMLEPGMLRSLAELDPIQATKKLREFLAGTGPAYKAGRSEEMWSDIARTLTGKRGMDAIQALKYIEQAKAGKRLTKPQESYVAKTVLKYGGAATTFGAANQ